MATLITSFSLTTLVNNSTEGANLETSYSRREFILGVTLILRCFIKTTMF